MQEKKRNNSPVKQRISQYADTLGVSRRDFYTKTGISRGTLENCAGITEDTLVKFIATYPQVSIKWLISGEGDMLRDNIKIGVTATDNSAGDPQPNPKCSEEIREVIAAKNEVISSKDEMIDVMRKYIVSLERIANIGEYGRK